MGYCVLHLEKGRGAEQRNVGTYRAHHCAKNTDPTRTHLNRELIMFPDGVCNRTLAIRHRLDTAGRNVRLERTKCRQAPIGLSGTHEDMARVEGEGT